MVITNVITLIAEFSSNISRVCIFVDARCTANIWRISGGQHWGSSKKDEPFWTHKIQSINDIRKIQERKRTRSEVNQLIGLVDFCWSMCLPFFWQENPNPIFSLCKKLMILKFAKTSDLWKVRGTLWKPSGESFHRTSHWATKQFLSSFLFNVFRALVLHDICQEQTKCLGLQILNQKKTNWILLTLCNVPYSKLLLGYKNLDERSDALVNRK